MQKMKGFFLLVCFSLSLSLAASVEKEPPLYALNALYHGAFAVVASQISPNPITLSGVTLESKDENLSQISFSYNRSDLARFSQQLEAREREWNPLSSFAPLSRTSRAMLKGYKMQDVLLDGVMRVTFSRRVGAREFLNMLFSGNPENVEFSIVLSMLVSLKNQGVYVFEGELTGRGEKSHKSIVVYTDHMSCNGQEIAIEPMVFAL